MRLLIDTHVFVWTVSEPRRLSSRARELLASPEPHWLLSVISAWEIQIKTAIGKMDLQATLAEMIEAERLTNGLQVLDFQLRHVFALGRLPPSRTDPFDRALAAQALAEALPIVSGDATFDQFGVERIW